MRFPVLACSLVAVGALSAISALPALGAATYYVSPDGSDANDGTTVETAFLTPHAAMTKAKAGDAVVAPKQTGEQGFYKVWVSDAPIEAE